MNFPYAALSAAVALTSVTAFAADYPAPRQGEWIAKDFKFHTGDTMPELRLHYTTIGEPTGQPVLVLHGSGGSAASMLTATFGGELFGPGPSRWMPRNTTSSFRTRSATANRPNPLTA
jgi:homoserine O-acetyltransferase